MRSPTWKCWAACARATMVACCGKRGHEHHGRTRGAGVVSVDARYFERLYQSTDLWGYRTRWYEQRKRALLLAMLHRPRYRRGLELGCSIGETTAALSSRCAELVATD